MVSSQSKDKTKYIKNLNIRKHKTMKLLLENREMLQDIGMSKELGSVALKYRKQKTNEDTTKFLQREETTRLFNS